MNLRHSLFFLSLLMIQYNISGQTTDLIISEYGEGSSGNSKYIEIYNGTGAAVDLSDYQLWRISNGGPWPEDTYDFSATTLAHDAALVVANNSGDVPGADEYDGFCSWNGDDAVGLAKDIGGTMTLIDAIGEDGADPGSGWDVAGVTDATANHRLVRKDTVCEPTTDWAVSAGTSTANSQWEVTSYSTGSAQAGHVSDCGAVTCPLVVIPGTAVCDDTTNGADAYTFELDFNGGGQGAGTYTITPANIGDDPDTDTTGVMVFQGVEGNDITIHIDSDDCDLQYTIASPVCSPLPQIILNEYQNDPDATNGDANGDGIVNTSEDEFVEFYNNGDSMIDLSGWEVHDNSGMRHTFPMGSVLDTGQFAVVFGGGTPIGIPGQLVQTASAGILGLGNSGDEILLYDDMGKLVIDYSYSGNSPGNNVAVGRNPDITGDFEDHDDIPYFGRLFSPGEFNVLSPPSCTLELMPGTAICSDTTSGMDTFTVVVTFTGGGQGNGTYTITPAFAGDHPDTTAAGTMTFFGVEPADITVTIMSDSCNITEVVTAPACEPPLPCAQEGDLVITEYMAASTIGGSSDGGEYFELYNRSDDTFNLQGYEISDLGSDNHTIISSIIMYPGEFVVLGRSGIVPNVDYVYSDFILSNNADEIHLRCSEGTMVHLITAVNYTQGNQYGSGVANELNCMSNANIVMSDADFNPGVDTFQYIGVPEDNFGSPGSLGTVDTQLVTPTQVLATDYHTRAGIGQDFTITLCITDADSLTPCGLEDYIVLEQIGGPSAFIYEDSLAVSGGCATFKAYVPHPDTCTSVSFTAHSSTLTLGSPVAIVIQEVIHQENFLCTGLTWSIENVDGQSTWECDTTGGYMSINGFSDINPSDDWLISPAFDLTTYEDLYISFSTRERFSGGTFEFLVSDDYSGAGDPNSATWTSIPFELDTTLNGFDFNPWTFSGQIDVNAYAQAATYFAFHYTAVNGDAAEWFVDNVSLIGCAKPCLITAVTVDNIGVCDPMTGTFTADIEVVYQDAPGSGFLVLSGDAADSIEVTSMAFVADSGSYIFNGIELDADGGLKTVTAYFTSDTTCVFEAVDLPGTDVASCDGGATVFGGLVINEVWNDVSYTGATCFSNKAFIELLVVASIDEDTTTQLVNLQNWIIDPSDDVADPGHMRIKSGCLTEVPVGALIVIYNADNVPNGISGPDEMDADSNLVYFIPSNSGCLEYTTDATFPGTTYTNGDDGSCTHAAMISAFSSSIPYAVETRHPHSFLRAYTNVYDKLDFNPAMPFTPQGASAFDCGNIDDPTAVLHDVTPSPGLSNSMNNAIIIDRVIDEAHVPDPDAINYKLLLSVGANPTCSELYVRPCLDTVMITGPLTVTDTIRAGLYILTSGDVTTSGNTVFDSPEILLEPGFEVPLGMEFTTLYVGCTPSALRHVRDHLNDSDNSHLFLPVESRGHPKR